MKITEVPPAVNLYFPADANVIVLVPVSLAKDVVCVCPLVAAPIFAGVTVCHVLSFLKNTALFAVCVAGT